MIRPPDTVEDCFRSFIWKPPEGFSDSECLDLIERLDTANRATPKFLKGEISADEFIQIKEWAGEDADEFIESGESNLEFFLEG